MAGKRLPFEIGFILCAKLAALTLLYFAFFSEGPHADSRAVLVHLTSGP
jgi:hypothetical protein